MTEGFAEWLRAAHPCEHPVRCAECARLTEISWIGWRAYRVDDSYGGEPPELCFFCPECAEREFGFGAV
jgi:hypothetical protein